MKLLTNSSYWALAGLARHISNIKQVSLSFIVLGAVASSAGAHPSNGLVAHYKMDGDAKDKGGSQLDGTLIGTVPTDDRYGKHNKALLFNGTTDLINCGNPSAFNFSGNFTLSAWVKQSGTQTARYIIAKYDFASGHDYGMGVAESAESYGFVLGDGPGYEDLRGSGALNDNAWHSMTMVFRNASTLNLYVDGVLNASLSVGSYPPFLNSAPLTIGGLLPGYGFGGAIDDVKIYDQALTSAEIARLFNVDTH